MNLGAREKSSDGSRIQRRRPDGFTLVELLIVIATETSYSAAAGRRGFAAQLATLATPCPSSSVAFISIDLALDPSIKSGYAIVLARAAASNVGLADCNGTPTATGYYSTATPVTAGNTGQRAFATTGNGTIFFDSNGTAPTEAAIAPGGGASPIQ